MSQRRKRLNAEQAAWADEDDLAKLFPVYPCPGSSAVVPFAGDDERVAAARLLAVTTWPSLTLEYVKTSYPCDLSALSSWLTPTGFVYYLPAFMRMCLLHPGEVNCLFQGVLSSFGRTDGSWQAVFGTLDDRQRKCIYRFLRAHFGQKVFDGEREVEIFGFWEKDMAVAARVLRVATIEEPTTSGV